MPKSAIQGILVGGTHRMDGIVRNAVGQVVGRVGANGQVWDDTGRGVGIIGSNGLVWDETMRDIGQVITDSGKLWDRSGRVVGVIETGGVILDAVGSQVGTVSDAPSILAGAAGLLLLLKPQRANQPSPMFLDAF